MAKECYRERSYARAIPGHFLTEFCRQTGLPEKFYGGETTMLSLKNSRDDYTYCKVGNTCLAFYLKEQYEPSSAHLMMTRSDSKYCLSEPSTARGWKRSWRKTTPALSNPVWTKR